MAIVVFVVTHYLGVKNHGRGYLREFMTPPGVPKALGRPLTSSSSLVRLRGRSSNPSLSVRLFANTIAGHLDYFGHARAPASVRRGDHNSHGLFIVIMLAFEVFVAFIQAYIFGLLSTVYIETAIYGSHCVQPWSKEDDTMAFDAQPPPILGLVLLWASRRSARASVSAT